MTGIQATTHCPACGEVVKSAWRICPACETRLQAMVCPVCRAEVKENWKRCPECEALLVCRDCGKRIAQGQTSCVCNSPPGIMKESLGDVYHDPVCGMAFIRVPGGIFKMGDTLNQGIETELPIHDVELSDFYMARHPVTQDRWQIVMEENPSGFQHPGHPVENVTWAEAREFARKITEAAKGAFQFMLPSEARWEYAARSCGKDDLHAGGDRVDEVAWYEENSRGHSHPVGLKKPNRLGLYDMSGNVWEWCEDTFLPDAYALHEKKNPVVTIPGSDRVIRGGSWSLDAWSARCARRFNFPADLLGPGLGFRLVMVPHEHQWP